MSVPELMEGEGDIYLANAEASFFICTHLKDMYLDEDVSTWSDSDHLCKTQETRDESSSWLTITGQIFGLNINIISFYCIAGNNILQHQYRPLFLTFVLLFF